MITTVNVLQELCENDLKALIGTFFAVLRTEYRTT